MWIAIISFRSAAAPGHLRLRFLAQVQIPEGVEFEIPLGFETFVIFVT